MEVRALNPGERSSALEDVARLRIDVFRDWPYLYDGDMAYEAAYLRPFAASDRAVLAGAFDGARLVGASTGAPLADHASDFAAAFATTDLDLDTIFYCAESVLLPAYRGRGVGHRFFDIRETFAREKGFTYSAFCGVIRDGNHPAKPADYTPLDAFWRGRGYAPLDGVVARFSWKDMGEDAETAKPLQFWIKTL